jgi:competence protein ComEA
MQEIVVPSSLRDRLEALTGRRRDVWIVAGVTAALVVAGLAWSSRGSSATIAPPSAAPPASPGAVSATEAPQGVVLVHVAGDVRRPGLYELPVGARVADAVEAAGGPRRRADLDALNLAQVVADGMKVLVGSAGALPSPVAEGTAAASDQLVSLNSADQAALETVPGIGPVKAAAILEYRAQIGTFDSLEQLLDVTGIGPATLEAIRPYFSL